MIKQISIENFRCFGKTDIKDFQRVNLIGGLNNSGKTVLLEAILLICMPEPQTILFLKNLRSEDIKLEEQYPEYIWDNFFLERDRTKTISINCTDNTLLQKYSKSPEQVLELKCQIIPNKKNKEVYNSDVSQKNSMLNGHFKLDNKVIESNMPMSIIPDYGGGYSFFLKTSDKKLESSLSYHSDPDYKKFKKIPDANFIGVTSRKKPHIIAQEYSILEKLGKEDVILKALQLIDKSITAINVSVIGGIHLGIKKSGKGFMPLSLFGDALNRIVQIILSIANNRGSVILIDEVENGIHHTTQREFWIYLFKIAKEFDVQVFATTHSLEMINAFSEVAGKDFVEDAAYFELVRHLKTGEIVGIKHKLATLEYEIHKKLSFRGEPSI